MKTSEKKPHAKIFFKELGKLVGARWQQITPEQLKYYEALSQNDSERYAHSGNSFAFDESGKKNSQTNCHSSSALRYEQKQSDRLTNSMSGVASVHYNKGNIDIHLNTNEISTAQENSA